MDVPLHECEHEEDEGMNPSLEYDDDDDDDDDTGIEASVVTTAEGIDGSLIDDMIADVARNARPNTARVLAESLGMQIGNEEDNDNDNDGRSSDASSSAGSKRSRRGGGDESMARRLAQQTLGRTPVMKCLVCTLIGPSGAYHEMFPWFNICYTKSVDPNSPVGVEQAIINMTTAIIRDVVSIYASHNEKPYQEIQSNGVLYDMKFPIGSEMTVSKMLRRHFLGDIDTQTAVCDPSNSLTHRYISAAAMTQLAHKNWTLKEPEKLAKIALQFAPVSSRGQSRAKR